MKTFKEFIKESVKSTNVEEVIVEIIEDEEFIINLPLVLSIDDSNSKEAYGDNKDYEWYYSYEGYDSESNKIINKYKLKPYLDKIFKDSFSKSDFNDIKSVPKNFDKNKEGQEVTWTYIDIKTKKYGRS